MKSRSQKERVEPPYFHGFLPSGGTVFFSASFSRVLKTSGALKRGSHVGEKWESEHHSDDPSSLFFMAGGK